jgi:hypothetical protein
MFSWLTGLGEKVFLNTKFLMRSEKVGAGAIDNVQFSTASSLTLNDDSFTVEYMEGTFCTFCTHFHCFVPCCLFLFHVMLFSLLLTSLECPRPGKEYSLMLQKRDDLYEAKCYGKDHKNYFGFKMDTREFVILSVIKTGEQAVCYETSCKGCAVVTTTSNSSNAKFDKLIELAYESVKIVDPAFDAAVYSIEKKHKFV